MSKFSKRTVRLPDEQVSYVDALVRSGAYDSTSDAIRAGLLALQERNEAVEKWLHEEVTAAYDANKRDPSRAIDLEAAFAEVRAFHKVSSTDQS